MVPFGQLDVGMSPPWTAEILAKAERQLLSKGSAWKPVVWRVDAPGCSPAIWKDGSHLKGLRRWVAGLQIRRERRCLASLASLHGFPSLLPVSCNMGFLTTFLPGQELDRSRFQMDPEGFAQSLRERVRAMHARGVFHLDLKQRRNILVDSEGGLHFLDFGAGWAPGWLCRSLLGYLLAFSDRQAVLKWVARWAPEQLSLADARSLRRGLLLRRLWPFTPHRDRGERAAIEQALRNDSGSRSRGGSGDSD